MNQQPVSPSPLPPDLDAWVRAGKGRSARVHGETVTLHELGTEPREFPDQQSAVTAVTGRQPWTTVRADEPLSQLAFVQRESDTAPEV